MNNADYWHKQAILKDKEIADLKKDLAGWKQCSHNWCMTADEYLRQIQRCPECMKDNIGKIGIACGSY